MIQTIQNNLIQILKKSKRFRMITILRLLNNVTELLVDTSVNQKLYLFCQLIISLQAILYLSTSFSMVETIIKWSDLSIFMQPNKIVVFSFILIIFSIILMVWKILFLEVRVLTEKPSFQKIYLGRIISYLQTLISSLFLAPLIRATTVIYMGTGSTIVLYFGSISIILAVIFIYPIYLIGQSGGLAITSFRGKICSLNLQLSFNLLRVIIPVASVGSQNVLIVLACFFLLLFIYFTWCHPVLSYRHNNKKQTMMSVIAYACIWRLQNQIYKNSYQNMFLWILGMISFCFMASALRTHRIRKILVQKQFTVKKTKILIFLIENIGQYNEILSAFLMRHHKQCQQIECCCENVKNALYSKEHFNLVQLQKEWYKLMARFIQSQYNKQKLLNLSDSNRLLALKQYIEVALNFSEIHLIKLEQINRSYYILEEYQNICETNSLSSFMSRLQLTILKLHIQDKMVMKNLIQGKMSSKIEQYIRFQIYFQQLKAIMKQSCLKINLFWVQTLKKEPDQSKITDIMDSIYEWNEKIERSHKHMLLTFENCSQIVSKALNQYYVHTLNIPNDSPVHINKHFTINKVSLKKKQMDAKIFFNSNYFGYNSQTPLCFVSVDRLNFGQILRYNQYFARLMKVEYLSCLKIQDLLIPQMRNGHQKKMKKYLQDDNYKLQHNHGITFNKDGYLMYHKIILQSFPSIENGLQYVVLFKKSSEEKKIFALKNKENIVYSSNKLVKHFGEYNIKQLQTTLKNNSIHSQLVNSKQCRIKIDDRDEQLLLLNQFNENDNNWLIIEIFEENYNTQGYTKSTFSQASILEQQADKAFKFISNYMSESSQNPHMQNSLIGNGKNSRNIPKYSAKICSSKIQQEINETFNILTTSKHHGIVSRTIKIYFVLIFIILVAILSSGYLKQQDIKSYDLLANTNRAYHKLMLNLNGVAIYSRIITYYTYININRQISQILFGYLNSFSQIIASLDNVIKNFKIQQILDDWPAFNCNRNSGIITEVRQNNLLSIADYIQNPVTNLISSRDYLFSMDKNSTKIPFTSTQCNYFQLILNVQYVTIPNLRKLKKDNLNQLLISRIQMSYLQIFVFSFAITILLLFIVFVGRFKNHIQNAKYMVYDIFHKTDYLYRRNRLERSQYYLMKIQTKGKSPKKSDISDITDEDEESSQFQSSLSKQSAAEDHREANNKIINHNQSIILQNNINLQKYEYLLKQKDFKIIKSIIIVIPIAFCFFSFYHLQFQQAKDIKNLLMIQDKLQIMQQNYNFVKLYAMQYVFQQSSFQKYLNSNHYLNQLAAEIFQIQRKFVDNSEDLSLLPNFAILIQEMAFSNLCDSKLFELKAIPNLCPIVGGGILTKGLYSTIINYLEQAKNLLYLHPNVRNYTFSQKIDYLGNPYFNDGVITIFIDEIFSLLLAQFSNDFNRISETKMSNYIKILIALGLYSLVFGVLDVFTTVKDMKNSLKKIKIVSILISLQSLRKNNTLQTLFTNAFEKFEKLN